MNLVVFVYSAVDPAHHSIDAHCKLHHTYQL